LKGENDSVLSSNEYIDIADQTFLIHHTDLIV